VICIIRSTRGVVASLGLILRCNSLALGVRAFCPQSLSNWNWGLEVADASLVGMVVAARCAEQSV